MVVVAVMAKGALRGNNASLLQSLAVGVLSTAGQLQMSFSLQCPALIKNRTSTQKLGIPTFGSQNRPIKTLPPTYFRLDAPLLEILPSGDIPSMSTSAIMPFHNVDSKLLH